MDGEDETGRQGGHEAGTVQNTDDSSSWQNGKVAGQDHSTVKFYILIEKDVQSEINVIYRDHCWYKWCTIRCQGHIELHVNISDTKGCKVRGQGHKDVKVYINDTTDCRSEV